MQKTASLFRNQFVLLADKGKGGGSVPCSPESEVLRAHLTPGGIAPLHCRIRSQQRRCVTFPLN